MSDIHIFQQPHPKYTRPSPTGDEIAKLRSEHDAMIAGFDAFLSDIGEYLLGLFHVNDTVSMQLEDPNDRLGMTNTTVWARGLRFSKDLPPGEERLLAPDTGEAFAWHADQDIHGLPPAMGTVVDGGKA